MKWVVESVKTEQVSAEQAEAEFTVTKGQEKGLRGYLSFLALFAARRMHGKAEFGE